MNPLVLTAMLIVANVLGAGMIVPQVVRLRRRRSADGLSGVWVGVSIALNLWWTAYALNGHLWGLLPVSIVATGLYLTIAMQYRRIAGRATGRPLATGFIASALLPVIGLAVGGWEAAGLAIGLSYGLQFGPAAAAALRAINVGGISPTTWSMAAIEAVIWLVYGATTRDPALIVGGFGGTVMALIILVRLAQLTSRSPQAVGTASQRRWTVEAAPPAA